MPQAIDEAGNIWEIDAAGNPVRWIGKEGGQSPQAMRVGNVDPFKVRSDQRANDAAARAAEAAARQAAAAEKGNENTGVTNSLKVVGDYNSDPTVKAYRVAVSQLAQALSTGEGAQADLALTYAFAKTMDPESVVRESEQGMVTSSQPWFQAAVENVKKQFGMKAGSFTPEARKALRAQIINSVKQRNEGYNARRQYFSDLAKQVGVDPEVVVGKHDGAPFLKKFQEYDQANAQPETRQERTATVEFNGKKFEFPVPVDATDDDVRRIAAEQTASPAMRNAQVKNSYDDSYLSQGLSGVNEGIASTLGAPVDIATAGLNLVPQGINAIANTDISQIEDPIGGSQWWKENVLAPTIGDPSADPSKQFTRRVGQSVGAAAIPAGMAGSIPRVFASIGSGVGGGVGGATAQQAFPGNPLAEIAGEALGGGLSGAAMFGGAKRNATRQMESRIPTVPELKQQAGDLYRAAEARGVTANPEQTTQLRDSILQTLRDEGQIGPLGRITDADTNTTKAFNLIDQYAGQPMRPVEMDTVRGVIADGRKSMDPSDQRLAGILTNQFDDWTRPLAPEFDLARGIASRYLQAKDLEQARELARAGASQFGNSGLENSLRTQYRGLDRADIRGTNHFSDDVTAAIQNVSRGTPGSNFARNLGRFAPTGPVSMATSVGIPSLAGGAIGGPVGGAIGATLGLAGAGGRLAANAMTNRAVDVAELTARNGGKLPPVNIMTPELEQLIAANAAAQLAKYVEEKKPKKRGLFGR